MEKKTYVNEMDRRKFIKTSMSGLAAVSVMGNSLLGKTKSTTSKIALVKSDNRQETVHSILTMLDFESPKGQDIFIKPNFNTSDLFPGSTHNDTLKQGRFATTCNNTDFHFLSWTAMRRYYSVDRNSRNPRFLPCRHHGRKCTRNLRAIPRNHVADDTCTVRPAVLCNYWSKT